MPEPKFPPLLRILETLAAVAKVAAVAALALLILGCLLGMLNAAFFVFFGIALIMGALVAVALTLKSLLVLIFYSRYSLALLLISFLAANACVAGMVSGVGIFIAMGALGMCILLSALFIVSLMCDPTFVQTEFPTYIFSSAHGAIQQVLVKPGDKVQAGQHLIIIEEQNETHLVFANCAATVQSIHVRPGQLVANGSILGVLKPDPPPAPVVQNSPQEAVLRDSVPADRV